MFTCPHKIKFLVTATLMPNLFLSNSTDASISVYDDVTKIGGPPITANDITHGINLTIGNDSKGVIHVTSDYLNTGFAYIGHNLNSEGRVEVTG